MVLARSFVELFCQNARTFFEERYVQKTVDTTPENVWEAQPEILREFYSLRLANGLEVVTIFKYSGPNKSPAKIKITLLEKKSPL